MNEIYLLLGTNIGPWKNHLKTAREKLEDSIGSVERCSCIYRTEAWGKTDQADFYNQALLLYTSISDEHRLLHVVLQIEKEMGRVRDVPWGPRMIDIDILFIGTRWIHDENLIVPHPRLQDRRFALAPLNEIASEFIHPLYNKSIGVLLKECKDPLSVKKLRISSL